VLLGDRQEFLVDRYSKRKENAEQLHEFLGFNHIGTFPEVGYKLGTWHDVGYWRFELSGASNSPSETC
jgi:L-amino acid N-acyltransferase YncA